MREKHRLRVFENRALRKIFGPKKEEVAGGDCIMMHFMICSILLFKHYLL
jgi:hypothetical protein